MKSLIQKMMMAAALMCAAQVSAQTATDPGEGLRATVGTTSGTTAISWWGKAGRSYFVQTCETLMEEDWRYVPVVEAGTEAVITWNLSSTAQRAFVRLIYTDQIYTGPVADADFDGDGLSNALEVAVGWGTDPFKADTDLDGWNDNQEKLSGSSGTNGAATPMSINQNYISMIRTYEAQRLTAGESYSMWRNKNSQGAWNDWDWGQIWDLPGDDGYDGGTSQNKPEITWHGYPFNELYTDTYWQNTSFYIQTLKPWEYLDAQDFYPFAKRILHHSEFPSYEDENGYWSSEWQRYRLSLAQPLPFDYSETFITVRYEYEENPEYLAASGPTSEYPWKRATANEGVTEVGSFTLTVTKGSFHSDWHEVFPTVASPGHCAVVQVVPVTMTLRANTANNPAIGFTPAPENTAHDAIVVGTGGIDRLGELPIGQGRQEHPGHSYAAPVEVYADVPEVPGMIWRWEREVTRHLWKIKLGTNLSTGKKQWEVKLDATHSANNEDDPIELPHQTQSRSTAGRVYASDSGGLNLLFVETLGNGEFAYEERQFTYTLVATHPQGGTFMASELPVAQFMALKRNANPISVLNTGNMHTGFDAKWNFSVVNVIDVIATPDEIRAAVGGNTPIVFE